MAADSRCVGQGYAKGLAELRPYLTPQDFAQFLIELPARSPGRVEALAATAAAAAAVQPPGPHTQAQAPGGAQRPAHSKGVDLPGWGAAHLAGAIGPRCNAAAVDAAAAATASLRAQGPSGGSTSKKRTHRLCSRQTPMHAADTLHRGWPRPPPGLAAPPEVVAVAGGQASAPSLRGAGAWPD